MLRRRRNGGGGGGGGGSEMELLCCTFFRVKIAIFLIMFIFCEILYLRFFAYSQT